MCLHVRAQSGTKKRRSTFFSVHAVKAYKGSRGIAPLLLTFHVSWSEWRLVRFISRNEPWYRLKWRLSGPKNETNLDYLNKDKYVVPTGILTADNPAVA